MSQISSDVLQLAQSLTGSLNGVKANDGSGGQWPPHGEHPVIVRDVVIKTDKIRYGPRDKPQEAQGILVSFEYRRYWDKQHPDYNPKLGDYLDFRGTSMTFLPGWERLPDTEQTRFRMSAERFLQAATVLLGLSEDECRNPAAVFPKLKEVAAKGPTVMLFCEHREDNKQAGKFYKTDYIRELLNGSTPA